MHITAFGNSKEDSSVKKAEENQWSLTVEKRTDAYKWLNSFSLVWALPFYPETISYCTGALTQWGPYILFLQHNICNFPSLDCEDVMKVQSFNSALIQEVL